MKISKRKMDFQSKSLPISRSPPLLARRIKTGADSVFQAFYVAPAQWFCHPTANWSTEGWHGRKKKQTGGWSPFIFCPIPSLRPVALFDVPLINLPSAPYSFSCPLCGAPPISSMNKMLITVLKAKAWFKEKFGREHVRILLDPFLQCSVRKRQCDHKD